MISYNLTHCHNYQERLNLGAKSGKGKLFSASIVHPACTLSSLKSLLCQPYLFLCLFFFSSLPLIKCPCISLLLNRWCVDVKGPGSNAVKCGFSSSGRCSKTVDKKTTLCHQASQTHRVLRFGKAT